MIDPSNQNPLFSGYRGVQGGMPQATGQYQTGQYQTAQAYMPPNERGPAMSLEQMQSRDRLKQILNENRQKMQAAPEFQRWLGQDSKPLPGSDPGTNADWLQQRIWPGH